MFHDKHNVSSAITRTPDCTTLSSFHSSCPTSSTFCTYKLMLVLQAKRRKIVKLSFLRLSPCFTCIPHFTVQFSSVQFSHSVISNSLPPHGLQHSRPPCPSPTPRVYSNSSQLSQWCHPTISPSVFPFSSCLQSFPASRSFQMSQLFTSGGQRFGVSASTLVLPMNNQDWFHLGWTGWISLKSKGLSRVFSNTTV